MSPTKSDHDLSSGKARTQAELTLMADLHPLLTKRAGGRDISGLGAYSNESASSPKGALAYQPRATPWEQGRANPRVLKERRIFPVCGRVPDPT